MEFIHFIFPDIIPIIFLTLCIMLLSRLFYFVSNYDKSFCFFFQEDLKKLSWDYQFDLNV